MTRKWPNVDDLRRDSPSARTCWPRPIPTVAVSASVLAARLATGGPGQALERSCGRTRVREAAFGRHRLLLDHATLAFAALRKRWPAFGIPFKTLEFVANRRGDPP